MRRSSARWRRTRRRSRSDSPPQIPNFSPWASAYSRHSTRTSQPRHTALASRVDAPRSGKKRSGSTPRQLASSCQRRSPLPTKRWVATRAARLEVTGLMVRGSGIGVLPCQADAADAGNDASGITVVLLCSVVDPSARGFFFASGAAGAARAQPGVRALGPCSASIREPTLRLVGPHLEVVLGDIVDRTRPCRRECREPLASRRRRRRRRHPPGRRPRACSRPAGSSAGCAFGDAKATPRLRPPARFVIHTVGPIWQGGHAGEARLLAELLPPLPRGRRRDRRRVGGVPRHQHRRLRLPGARGHADRGRDRPRHASAACTRSASCASTPRSTSATCASSRPRSRLPTGRFAPPSRPPGPAPRHLL